MDDETHRFIDKSVDVVSAQNDSRFTKASSEVKNVQAEMNVTKTELGAKVDGLEAQVASLRTELLQKIDELTAKIDSLHATMKSGFEMLNDRLKAQNPLTAWQIVGIVIGAMFDGATLLAGTLFGFHSISGTTLAATDNRAEMAEIVAEAFARSEANRSLNATPMIAPGIQGPDEGDSDSLPSVEPN